MRTGTRLFPAFLISLAALMISPLAAQAASAANPVAAHISPAASHARSVVKKVFTSANPRAAYDALSPSDKAFFKAAEVPATVRSTTTYKGLGANAGRVVNSLRPTASFSGCWAMQDSAAGYSALGVKLYSYGQSTEVCVSGGSVYYVVVYNVWQQVNFIGWRYASNWPATFNAGWEGRGLVQWEFILGAGGWDIQYAYPCLQGRLNADGHNNWWNQSCNLS